jgi:hypothetical protein
MLAEGPVGGFSVDNSVVRFSDGHYATQSTLGETVSCTRRTVTDFATPHLSIDRCAMANWITRLLEQWYFSIAYSDVIVCSLSKYQASPNRDKSHSMNEMI